MSEAEREGAAERKSARFQAKSVRPDGTFEGYASVFGAEDLGRDIVMPGAFARSLARRGPKGVKLLYQHDAGAVIGVWNEIREDARGLFVRGRLLTDVARAREVLALMRAGAVDGLSIGYHVVRAEKHARRGARRRTELDLWELSVVTFPMLPEARISAVKRLVTPDAALARALRAAARLFRS